MMNASPAVNLIPVERYWFLTWTTYGTWLPGDERGYVGWTFNEAGDITNHNQPHSPPAPPNPRLSDHARRQLKSSSLVLSRMQAEALLEQFQETTAHRGWLLVAAAILATHVHTLLGVPGDPAPEQLLRDLKAYGSRRLNRGWHRPASGTWWTANGSTRKVDTLAAIPSVVRYIRDQRSPLVIWTRDEGRVV